MTDPTSKPPTGKRSTSRSPTSRRSASGPAEAEDLVRDEFGREIGARVLQRLALRWATQWCDRREAERPCEHDLIRGPHDRLGEQALADVLREAGNLAAGAATAGTPDAFQVRCGVGPGGLVVMVHGPRWSLVARAGGPIAVVCPEFPDGVSLGYEPSSPTDPIAALVSALIALARRSGPPARGAVRKNL